MVKKTITTYYWLFNVDNNACMPPHDIFKLYHRSEVVTKVHNNTSSFLVIWLL